MNKDYNVALNFHNLTKHSYLSVRTDRYYLDWDNFPYPFKVYENVEKIKLPKAFPKPNLKALEALSSKMDKSKELTINEIAELLYFTAGISRVFDEGLIKYYFRVAPATGALYSTELYLVCCNLEGIKAGLYHFDPYSFSLDVLRLGDYREILSKIALEERIKKAPLSIILTSIGWRNVWKYRKRSYRHWYWDSGAMTANLLAVANAEGLDTKVIMGFKDQPLNKLLAIDGRKECALSIISIGPETYISENYETSINEKEFKVRPLSKKEIEYKEIYQIHEASSLFTDEELLEWKNSAKDPFGSLNFEVTRIHLTKTQDESDELWKVILRRGSTRKFSRKPIPFSSLSTILIKTISELNADFLATSKDSLIEYFLIVNEVESLESGAYHFNKSMLQLEFLKKGKFRNVSQYLCLEQELGGDASVVIFLMSNLNRALQKFGNRGYRLCNYEAGIRAGRIYLAAYSLNIGATGLTFYDDDIIDFFSPYSKDMQNIMVVAIGVPAYKAKMGKIYAGFE
jgi:SagB-type dehydrogenase family enzyme